MSLKRMERLRPWKSDTGGRVTQEQLPRMPEPRITSPTIYEDRHGWRECR
jgi:hypothetical protein